MSEALEKQFGSVDFVNDKDRGAQNLIEFLKHSPNVIALINAVMPEFQELYDAQKDVYSNINIFNAVGSQLDHVFGTLLDLERETAQTDEDYRVLLLGRATILSRSGEISSLKSIYKNLIQANSVALYEFRPPFVIVNGSVDDVETDFPASVVTEMNRAKQGGTGIELIITTEERPLTFGDVNEGEVIDDRIGFSGVNIPTDGGLLGRVLR